MKSAASILALATSALAATIEVQVSSVFTPDSITAADGDIIQFNFQSQHSVARSDFSSPCVGATDNAIYSGQLNSGDVFSFTYNGSDPLWLYCGVGRHCQGGQVMVVNPPASGDQSLDAYRTAAGSAGNSQNPQGVQGGILGDASALQGGSASASAAPTAESSSAPTGASGSATSRAASVTASGSAAPSATGANAAGRVGVAGVAGFAGMLAAVLA